MINVLLAHAYSTLNRGDGLLVELSKEVVWAAFGKEVNIRVLAIDAESFHDPTTVVQYAPASKGALPRLAGVSKLVASTWFRNISFNSLIRSDFEQPDLIIGVGGGYLRTDGGVRSFKSLVAHGLQMRWLQSLGAPTFYLPQSVGPLRGVQGQIIKRWITRIDRLNLRDDRSVNILRDQVNIRRMPDLAVSSIARGFSGRTRPSEVSIGPPRLIARHLHRSERTTKRYESNLRLLMDGVTGLVPALQSSGRGNDDPSFYIKMGWKGEAPYLRDIVEGPNKPPLVISVRLHGALESIISGIPAIHLSYERKGFGAYDDLGISDFVHNANDFDANLVIRQARAIQDDPEVYWSRIERSIDKIKGDYSGMVLDLRSLVGSGFL